MSKSLGNVVRIRDAIKQYGVPTLRFYFASFHYRQPMVLSATGLTKATAELTAINKNLQTFTTVPPTTNPKHERKLQVLLERSESAFRRSMDDDFDTPKALSVLKALAKNLSSLRVKQEAKQRAEATFLRMANVFGILPQHSPAK
jgi:cysteinyl-tRNA synthetase